MSLAMLVILYSYNTSGSALPPGSHLMVTESIEKIMITESGNPMITE